MKGTQRKSVILALALGLFLCGVFYFQSSRAQSQFSAPKSTAQARRLFDLVSTKKLQSFASSAGVVEQEIAINFDKLDFEQTEILTFSLLDGRSYEAFRRKSEGFQRFAANEFSWRGKIEGLNGWTGDVILTMKGRAMSGLIYSPDAVYEIVPQKDFKNVLVQLNQDLFQPCGVKADSEDQSATDQNQATADVVSSDDGTLIDVLVVYTTPVRTALGGTTQAEAFAQQAVNAANTAYQNSEINPRLRLVGTMEAVGYTENGLSAALSWVRNDANVAAARNAANADLVAILVENDTSACGLGSLMRTVRPSFANSAFSATRRGCAVGNLTFAHELGHNQGCDHNPENSTAGTPSYPFAFGHYVDGLFRTVMSYVDQCPSGCARSPYFSNPAIMYAGAPTGVWNQRDNHQVINNTALTVSQFRSVGCVAPGTFAQTSPGNGQSVSSTGASVTLSWTPSANATAYEIYFGNSSNIIPLVGSQAATTRNVTVSVGQTYYWKVMAYSCNGLGESTPVRSFSVSSTGPSQPFELLLEQFGPVSNLVSAMDSMLLLRDPFPVTNIANPLNPTSDKNTRVVIFLSNFQLEPGETAASVVVNLIGSNNQSFDIAAEDVRFLPNSQFTQVTFRLPNGLAAGTCTLSVKARGQTSNSGIIRISG